MQDKNGKIHVSTENIFPIIRQWLYSDQDIFLRELISNATDAISKRNSLLQLGELDFERLPGLTPEEREAWSNEAAPGGRIDVVLDQEAKTLRVSDNGIGMTAEEIDRYINEIAFSGAVDFIQQYQDQTSGDEIIGHFGLGFYSVFMVAEKVEIESRSARAESMPAHWESQEGMDFTLRQGNREHFGTDIILHLTDSALNDLTGARIREILHTYSHFMPYPIFFEDQQAEKRGLEERQKAFEQRLEAWKQRKQEAEKKGETFEEAMPTAPQPLVPQPINDTEPLWKANPREVSEEAYRQFYRDTFQDYREPLFWIHLNMDYPFRVQGVLYFPQMDHQYESLEGRIKIYANRVFVADNIKEVIPDYLFLLKGCLDIPELPLNVSRSFLQNDAHVRKLAEYIVRRVAERLTQLYKEDRAQYEKCWSDISVFVKYGCLKDEKFFKRVKEALLFQTTDQSYLSFDELPEEKLHYTDAPEKQLAYTKRYEAKGEKVLVLDHELDQPLISFLEHQNQLSDDNKKKVSFARVDADLAGEEGLIERQPELEKLFREVSGQPDLKLEVRALGEEEAALVLLETEASRRMQQMRQQFAKMQGQSVGGMDLDKLFPVEQTLLANTDHPLLTQVLTLEGLAQGDEARRLAAELYDLARLSHGSLEGADLLAFLARTSQLLQQLKP